MAKEYSNKPTTIYSMKNAAYEALLKIHRHRIGDISYLKTRFPILNERLLGGFTYDQIVLLGGASGHGKSYFLQMLRADFMNQQLNGHLKEPFKWLHFNLEMSMAAEIMRELVAGTQYSYKQLISFKDQNYDYYLEDKAFEEIKARLKTMSENDTLYFINTPGTKYAMYETIMHFHAMFPSHRLIISLDHTLLVEMFDERSEVQLEADIGKMFIQTRQQINSLNILVAQLNDRIEDPKRKEPGFQFPTKTDFHGSKQVYQAADLVLVVHRPELLNIDVYGREPEATMTHDLVALHVLKFREYESGYYLRFTQDFANGGFKEYTHQSINYNI